MILGEAGLLGVFGVVTSSRLTSDNSLITVAEFDTYMLDRGYPNTYTAEQKESAIIIASVDYIDTFFTFLGTRLDPMQGMQLPTTVVTITAAIKRACANAAYLHLIGRLFVNPTTVLQVAVTSESKSVGSLSKSQTFSENIRYTNKYPTAAIDKILNSYTVSGGGNRYVRA